MMQPVHFTVGREQLIHELQKRNRFTFQLIDTLAPRIISDCLRYFVVLSLNVRNGVPKLVNGITGLGPQPTNFIVSHLFGGDKELARFELALKTSPSGSAYTPTSLSGADAFGAHCLIVWQPEVWTLRIP
jgi:hypothetical protein